MIDDILTVMWKESKGLLKASGSRARTAFNLIVPILMFGIVLPIQLRDEWLGTGWSIIVATITPLILIATTIAESFAGERERHTLETLLASRLPDRAILFGKLLLSIAFGWGMTLLLLLMSLAVVNILQWNGRIQVFTPAILAADVSVGLLMSGLVASLGILVSLRAATVQGAQQTIVMLLAIPLLTLQVAAFLLPTFLPREVLKSSLQSINTTHILWIFVMGLLAANVGLGLAALARFQRSHLILD